jgi:predicted secreted Zn-dependent protease
MVAGTTNLWYESEEGGEVVSNPNTGLAWHKATASATGNCVEVAVARNSRIMVRDSKNPAGGLLAFTEAEWHAFLDGVAAGEFTLDSLRGYRAHPPECP